MEPALPRQKPSLRIRHLFIFDAVKRIDAKRLLAAEFETVAGHSAAADKNPNVTLIIYIYAGVIMRVIHALFIVNDHRPRHGAGFVVEARCHD